MAKGTVNRVTIIGNLGADPEVRYMPNGDAIASMRVATTELSRDNNSGEYQEYTEWHRITLFGKTGEIAGKFLRKGSKIYIEGRLRTRKWQDKTGQDRYTTEIIGDRMEMLSSKSSAGTSDFDADPGYAAPSKWGSEARFGSDYNQSKGDNASSSSDIERSHEATVPRRATEPNDGYQPPSNRLIGIVNSAMQQPDISVNTATNDVFNDDIPF